MSSWGLRKWWKWTTDKIAKQHATKQILDDSFKSVSDLGFLKIKKADLIIETFKIKVFDKMSDFQKTRCRTFKIKMFDFQKNKMSDFQKTRCRTFKIKMFDFQKNKMSDCRKQDVGLLNQDVRLQKQNVGLLKIKIYNFEE